MVYFVWLTYSSSKLGLCWEAGEKTNLPINNILGCSLSYSVFWSFIFWDRKIILFILSPQTAHGDGKEGYDLHSVTYSLLVACLAHSWPFAFWEITCPSWPLGSLCNYSLLVYMTAGFRELRALPQIPKAKLLWLPRHIGHVAKPKPASPQVLQPPFPRLPGELEERATSPVCSLS